MFDPSIILEAEEFVRDDFNSSRPLGQGLYKTVYLLPSGRAVVKVIRDDEWGGADRELLMEYEWALYVYLNKKGLGSSLATSLFCEDPRKGMYIIQELVTPAADLENRWVDDSIIEELEFYGVTDLHLENYGMTPDERTVAIDWGYIPSVDWGSDEESYERMSRIYENVQTGNRPLAHI